MSGFSKPIVAIKKIYFSALMTAALYKRIRSVCNVHAEKRIIAQEMARLPVPRIITGVSDASSTN